MKLYRIAQCSVLTLAFAGSSVACGGGQKKSEAPAASDDAEGNEDVSVEVDETVEGTGGMSGEVTEEVDETVVEQPASE